MRGPRAIEGLFLCNDYFRKRPRLYRPGWCAYRHASGGGLEVERLAQPAPGVVDDLLVGGDHVPRRDEPALLRRPPQGVGQRAGGHHGGIFRVRLQLLRL